MTEKFEMYIDRFRYEIEPTPEPMDGKWVANVTVTKYEGSQACGEPVISRSALLYKTKDIAIDESIDLARRIVNTRQM